MESDRVRSYYGVRHENFPLASITSSYGVFVIFCDFCELF